MFGFLSTRVMYIAKLQAHGEKLAQNAQGADDTSLMDEYIIKTTYII